MPYLTCMDTGWNPTPEDYPSLGNVTPASVLGLFVFRSKPKAPRSLSEAGYFNDSFL